MVYIIFDVLDSPDGDLRLVGGSNSNHGRLEVKVTGAWGTVCDDNFGEENAKVTCQQLGLPSSQASALHGAYFGQGSGPIWLDEVSCSGFESRLVDCGHNDFGNNDCEHWEDVSVICSGM